MGMRDDPALRGGMAGGGDEFIGNLVHPLTEYTAAALLWQIVLRLRWNCTIQQRVAAAIFSNCACVLPVDDQL
jgi:hypothetical protein